jgi:hypothetical protein
LAEDVGIKAVSTFPLEVVRVKLIFVFAGVVAVATSSMLRLSVRGSYSSSLVPRPLLLALWLCNITEVVSWEVGARVTVSG